MHTSYTFAAKLLGMEVTYALLSPLADRFWGKVDKAAPDECWPWRAGASGRGYGQFHLTGRTATIGAHRVAWMLHNRRSLPGRDSGLVVDHLCNQPICCNPNHLHLKTNVANTGRGQALTPSGRTPERLASGRYKVRFRQTVEGRRVQSSRSFDTEQEALDFIASRTRENA